MKELQYLFIKLHLFSFFFFFALHISLSFFKFYVIFDLAPLSEDRNRLACLSLVKLLFSLLIKLWVFLSSKYIYIYMCVCVCIQYIYVCVCVCVCVCLCVCVCNIFFPKKRTIDYIRIIVGFFFGKKIIFSEKNLFYPWILFTLSLPGIFKFNILSLNILFVLIWIIPYSGFTGLNNIYIYIYICKNMKDQNQEWFKKSFTS